MININKSKERLNQKRSEKEQKILRAIKSFCQKEKNISL
jgi:hypothetical protein